MITLRHTTLSRTPGRETGPTQRPLPDNTRQSQETDIHAPGGIRPRKSSKRAAASPSLRPRGHRVSTRPILNKVSIMKSNLVGPLDGAYLYFCGQVYNNAMSDDGNILSEGPCILYIKLKVKFAL